MSNRFLFIIIGIAITLGILATFVNRAQSPTVHDQTIATSTATSTVICTADAMQCPDGSYAGRTGPNCEFMCPELPTVPSEVQAAIDAKSDLIAIANPRPLTVVTSPLHITGHARGNWFFEASAPVLLTDAGGRIIAKGTIHADGNWMTSDFVPFSADLTFVSPFKTGEKEEKKKGSLIFKKDNPSGDPKNDESLEIPIEFAP
jgi:hypothetical protein